MWTVADSFRRASCTRTRYSRAAAGAGGQPCACSASRASLTRWQRLVASSGRRARCRFQWRLAALLAADGELAACVCTEQQRHGNGKRFGRREPAWTESSRLHALDGATRALDRYNLSDRAHEYAHDLKCPLRRVGSCPEPPTRLKVSAKVKEFASQEHLNTARAERLYGSWCPSSASRRFAPSYAFRELRPQRRTPLPHFAQEATHGDVKLSHGMG
ncbi:hypothetical protein PHYSODRAFT_293869 [Phytophthora sojae]|uniref:Uncharacterized protein n=1 Tax=Phytophthora sojae (strain P6497) TaxID=1094619 RepID=G4YPI9_PHYSP|nr:hypothetical protein PHYSODRAFT_293869 [Phytophthora sojae]EGZ28291.1 hypothetical protein PHYSODRAFT_293869 [Phytophthora sojae]|eukprot:XP_009515566.1 hypothetical protein PHYSODRAFT_293869 [Phytophthora sojae]